jgi:prepilin-type N-terminal cleavage/methylation domain-containing protein
MLKRLQEARKNEKGFTLIELLIVIVILGVLAGIVVFAVGGITDTGKKSACSSTRKTVETGVEAFRAQTGGYPATVAALVPGYLHDDPTVTGYNANFTIAYDATSHLVTGTAGGAAC